TGSAYLKEPMACTERERQEFERLVRQGFAGSDEGLPSRIRDAKWLAFHYTARNALGAIAALKAPTEEYRRDVFEKADAGVSHADYELELGWVFVAPAYRGKRIAESLCAQLVSGERTAGVFATTRTNNTSMIRILHALSFSRVGNPYRRRDERLVLFLRPPP
ncbi:MAG: hypothetical protein PVJ43_11915, partial [Gemmatimonadales bacterium]